MKKIIILSDAVEPRYGLVSHLKTLFPECEIEIIQRRPESVKEDMITATTVFGLKKSGEIVT